MATHSSKSKTARFQSRAHGMQKAKARALDDLAEFEEFQELILKEIRKDIMACKRGALTSKEMREKWKFLADGRVLTIAATEADPQKALAACKDILDRTEGKAKETQEVKHRFENLPDDELDAVIKSKLDELEADKHTH